MAFPGGSVDKESTCNVGDLGWIPGLGRSPGEGTGRPVQYTGLENPIVHGVEKSWTQLSDFPLYLLCTERKVHASVKTQHSQINKLKKKIFPLKTPSQHFLVATKDLLCQGMCLCALSLSRVRLFEPARLLCPWDSPAIVLEWVAKPSFRGSSQPRDPTQVSHIAGRFFINRATREAQEYWSG